MIERECVDYDTTLNITRADEGVHVDYVAWTHGFPYNMMYGLTSLHRTGHVGVLLGGTPMEYKSPKQYELFNIVKYMFEAACYKGQGFMGFNGRGTASTEAGCGVSIMNGVLSLIGLFGEEEDMHIKKLIKRCASTPEIVKKLKTACSVYEFAKLMEILRDDTIPTVNDYELGYAWFTGDRFAQHRNDYAYFVAMPSSRHPNYESINSANKRGWYTCDGSVYYYNNTDRNAYDGVNFITNPNLCQRVAGTTVDERPRQVWSYRGGWKPQTDFSGTMDVLKKYGMAAFDYESYHYEGHEADGTEDKDYGGGFTYWENDLVAKKSYYFFDKECVCLGAGINSTMNAEVLTTLEHRRLVKDGETLGCEDVYVNGELMPKGDYEKLTDGAKWISLEGFAGFVLPAGGDARISKYTFVADGARVDDYFVGDPNAEKYKNGKPFFEINLLHGKNPKDASYQYIALPNATKEATEAYAEAPEVEIIANTKRIQAVRKASLGLTFITFHEAGECCGIKVNAPCIVSILEANGEKTVAVADPTHKNPEIKLTLDKAYKLIYAPILAKVGERCGKTCVSVATKELAGEAVRVTFKA
jgi:hyaluronate lyase